MITFILIAVAYIVIATITGRLIYNTCLTNEYKDNLKGIISHRENSDQEVWTETAEEAAFRIAKDRVNYDDGLSFFVGLGSWFWPITFIIYFSRVLALAVWWLFSNLRFLEGSAERQVKSIKAEKQRKALLDEQEAALSVKKDNLIKLAKELELETKGLESL
jgi:hypothetical protein